MQSIVKRRNLMNSFLLAFYARFTHGCTQINNPKIFHGHLKTNKQKLLTVKLSGGCFKLEMTDVLSLMELSAVLITEI